MSAHTVRRRSVDISDESDEIPPEVSDAVLGVMLAAGGANVIMQLAQLPVGHGVVTSGVDSGRVDRHPLKRLRTTSAFLVTATFGTTKERLALRREIDGVHAQVRSAEGAEVAFDAFDPELQLWVAACLYRGLEDVVEVVDGRPLSGRARDVIYEHGRRLGTTLQVPPELWPEDRDAFEDYWQQRLATISMDELTRPYLRDIADLAFVVEPLGPAGEVLKPFLRPIGRFMTLGFLAPEFREELGLTLSDDLQRLHARLFGTIGRFERRLPAPLKALPLNVILWDTRRRMRRGRAVLDLRRPARSR